MLLDAEAEQDTLREDLLHEDVDYIFDCGLRVKLLRARTQASRETEVSYSLVLMWFLLALCSL